MKTLEAKPFDQNAENWKWENRLFISTMLEAGASGQNRIGTHALRSHRTVWFVFRWSNSCFLLETDIGGHERLFLAKWHPKAEKKTAKTAVFRHRWQAWKVVRSIAAVRQCPRTPRNWRCSFAFFETFLWHFNKKQRGEVIFRLPRPVSWKNQENGSGKRWSLHAPHKLGGTKKNLCVLCYCDKLQPCCWALSVERLPLLPYTKLYTKTAVSECSIALGRLNLTFLSLGLSL